MITREKFVSIMNRLKELNKKIEGVDSALKALSPDFGGFCIPEATDIVLEILTETLGDRFEWINYFVYERDWLDDYYPGCIRESNDSFIDLSDWGKIYDFIQLSFFG